MLFLLTIGILLGIFLSPLLEALLYFIVTHKKKKPVIKPCIHIPTPGQAKQLFNSTHVCTDLAWFNVCLQRYFVELSQSYAYKDKLKRTMLKKIKPFEKYVSVDIESIDLGKEFPMFSSVRVLTDKMLDDIYIEKSRKKSYKGTKKEDSESNDSSDFDNEFIETLKACKEEMSKDLNKDMSTARNKSKSSSEDELQQKEYKNGEIQKDSMAKKSLKQEDTLEKNDVYENNIDKVVKQKETLQEHDDNVSIRNKSNDSQVEILKYEINKNITASSICPSTKLEDQLSTNTLANQDVLPSNSKNNVFEQENAEDSAAFDKEDVSSNKTPFIENEFADYDNINFSNVVFLFEMEYKGTIQIKINVTISKNLKIPASFTLNYLKGPMLVRLPALLNHTRLEFNIVKIDKLEFLLDSDLNNKYLKKTITNILHNLFLRMFKSNYLFPKFFPQYLPSVIPSTREITYKYDSINDDETAQECIKNIMLIMMMDYRVRKVYHDIVYRKGNYNVNGTSKRIMMNDINVKDLLIKMKIDTDKNGKSNKKETSYKYLADESKEMRVKNERIADIEFQNNFLKKYVANLSILQGDTNYFIEIENVKNFKCYDKLTLKFADGGYKFVRLFYEDCIIFQSDESNEFFSFRLRSMQVLEVFYYATNKHFIFNEKRMLRIQKKLEEKALWNLDAKDTKEKMVSSKFITTQEKLDSLNNFASYIQDLANNTYAEPCKVKEIKINLPCKEVLECLEKKQRLRFMLNFDTFKVTKDLVNGTQITGNSQTKPIYTVIDKNYIIDKIGDQILNGYVCFSKGTDQTLLKIIHQEEFSTALLNTFICFINIEERLIKCKKGLIMFENVELKKKKFSKTYKVNSGFVYIEIITNPGDEFYFYVYNKTQKRYEIDQLKVMGQADCEQKINCFGFGSKDNFSFSVYVHAKYGVLNNNLRIYTNMDEAYFGDFYINAHVELNKKCKFQKVLHHKNKYSVFWDNAETLVSNALVCNNHQIGLAGTGTMLLNENKAAITLYNKSKTRLRLQLKIGVVDLHL